MENGHCIAVLVFLWVQGTQWKYGIPIVPFRWSFLQEPISRIIR